MMKWSNRWRTSLSNAASVEYVVQVSWLTSRLDAFRTLIAGAIEIRFCRMSIVTGEIAPCKPTTSRV